MNRDELQPIYDTLKSIYSDGAFGQIALNESLEGYSGNERTLITKIVYGVIENDGYLNYIISKVVQKKPQSSINLILKIGAYALKFLSIQPFAIVNNIVDFTKAIGKKDNAGFVNAVLKKISITTFDLPKNRVDYLSVKYSYPRWFVVLALKQYGDETESLLSSKIDERAHIRVNSRKISLENFSQLLFNENIGYEQSKIGGFFVKYQEIMNSKIDDGLYTVQSVGSCIVCDIVGSKSEDLVMDACSSPGGKSVNLSERSKKVIACDIHEHRVSLVKKYAAKMGASNVLSRLQDATINNVEYNNMFDRVLCDVPCSGFGVCSSRPDIKLSRKESDIAELEGVQLEILNNCSKYVKRGGYIIYSTCTVLACENQDIVLKFLSQNENFVAQKINISGITHKKYGEFVQFLPYLDKVEGFFVAKLRRVK